MVALFLAVNPALRMDVAMIFISGGHARPYGMNRYNGFL